MVRLEAGFWLSTRAFGRMIVREKECWTHTLIWEGKWLSVKWFILVKRRQKKCTLKKYKVDV